MNTLVATACAPFRLTRRNTTYAHNIKIISQNGTVTLKGPVKSF